MVNFAEKFKELLDKSNLEISERKAFEDFIDGKRCRRDDVYPDWEKDLEEAWKDKPLLKAAFKKIKQAKTWGSIITLIKVHGNS